MHTNAASFPLPYLTSACRYFGMMNQSLFPIVALAQIVNILFLNVFFLFGGFFVPYTQFPVWWKW